MLNLNFTPFPFLSTENYMLRQLTDKDDKEIFILRSDERVLKYLDIQKAETLDDARKFIEKINAAIKINMSIYWAISGNSSSKLLGTICLWNITESPNKADIGFTLLPDQFGKGIMQEILPAVIDYGFNIMKLEKIEGDVAPDNIKSIKLMEKFGFIFSKKLEYTDIYSLDNTYIK